MSGFGHPLTPALSHKGEREKWDPLPLWERERPAQREGEGFFADAPAAA